MCHQRENLLHKSYTNHQNCSSEILRSREFIHITTRHVRILWLAVIPIVHSGLTKRYNLVARFMGPTWGPSGTDRIQVGHMLAP